jgi:transcriptional regulator with XRE-family HTH domain
MSASLEENLHSRKRTSTVPDMAKTFKDWFREVRERKQLTQTQVAEQLKLSSPTISRWEAGTEPRASHLVRICSWAPIEPRKLLSLFPD